MRLCPAKQKAGHKKAEKTQKGIEMSEVLTCFAPFVPFCGQLFISLGKASACHIFLIVHATFGWSTIRTVTSSELPKEDIICFRAASFLLRTRRFSPVPRSPNGRSSVQL